MTDQIIPDMENTAPYMKNLNIKSKGVEIQWTKEMVEEYQKCAADPVYFIQKYIQIVHVDHGLIPIDMFDYQKEIVEKITNHRRMACVTSRQAGKTTVAVAIILHYVLFQDHKTVALLANKGDSAREILDRIKISYEGLPTWLQQGVVEWNKGSVELENGCKILAGSTSSSSIRGKSVSFLYIDEAAFVEGWDEFFTSVYPTISSGKTTKILLTSTPNGLNHFYKTCDGAEKQSNGYQFIKVMWYDIPGRDEHWKQETLEGMDFDYEKFGQEFECQFLGSSGTLISGSKLKQLVYQEPFKKNNDLSMYKQPVSGNSYVITVDVSRGKGLDYSAFQVIDVTKMPYQQVCVYRNNMIVPTEYVQTINHFARLYNEASVLIEINDIGEEVANKLYEDFEYDNILFTKNNGRSGKSLLGGLTSNADRGIRTTKNVKSVGCSVLKLLVEQDQLIINDFNTIQELSTFSRKGVSWEAEPGNHDDLVMCLVIFAWATNQQYFRELTDINTMSNLRDRNDEQMMNELTPFGLIQNGHDVHEEDDFLPAVSGDDWLAGDWDIRAMDDQW